MAPKVRHGGKILAKGPKACLQALRSLVSVGTSGGDTYSLLHQQSQWPREVHENIYEAWSTIADGGFEVPSHVVLTALTAVCGLKVAPGLKIRLPNEQSDHPTSFVRGTSKSGTNLLLRDFVQSLVRTTEATIARDATGRSLARGGVKLDEQRALREHLGLPRNASAGRARLKQHDVKALLADVGVCVDDARIARLISIASGPYPDVPALVRDPKQPVPYLEAERLLLCTLTGAALRRMLAHSAEAPAQHAVAKQIMSKPLPPSWLSERAAAVQQANIGGWSSDASGGCADEGGWHASQSVLPRYAPPVSSLDASLLERWWLGVGHASNPMGYATGNIAGA